MRLVWLEGERAAYAGKPGRLAGAAAEKALDQLLEVIGKKQAPRASDVTRLGDEKLEELAEELGTTTCDAATLKILLGRLGDAFAERAVAFVRAAPHLLEGAIPIESAELVGTAATLLFGQDAPADDAAPHAPSAAESWLLRHAAFSAGVLAPLAKNGIADAHGCALAFLAVHGKAPPVDWLAPFAALAPRSESEPAIALRAARGRRDVAEAPKPAAKHDPLPAFFDVAKLPRPTLKDDGAPLSDDEVREIGHFLRASTSSHPHAELAKVRFRCDRASLDAFVVGLLDAWCDASSPYEPPWPLEACGTLGGDGAARAVAKHVRAWSRSRYDSRGKIGCNVLAVQAQHGSEIARVLLEEIGRTGGRTAREEAAKLTHVVEVTSQEEAKVPTLGLDASGSLELDVGGGGGMYRVVFDEALVPRLVDASGERVDAFPRLRKGMDAKKWETAKAIHAGMVKDSKTIARHELALLERLMCNQESQSLDSFRERWVEHPLLRQLARRLVWRAGKTMFRVTEDATFADEDDKAFTPSGEIGLAHPALMTDAQRDAWIEHFAEYEIVQPFPQLARETFVADDQVLSSVAGAKASRGRIFQLVSRGWALKYDRLERELEGGGGTARVHFTGAVGSWSDEYTIDAATCTETLRSLPRAACSELLRDVRYLAGK
jgi:hypothetical protein